MAPSTRPTRTTRRCSDERPPDRTQSAAARGRWPRRRRRPAVARRLRHRHQPRRQRRWKEDPHRPQQRWHLRGRQPEGAVRRLHQGNRHLHPGRQHPVRPDARPDQAGQAAVRRHRRLDGRLHGLADAAERAGARIHERNAATAVTRAPDGTFLVETLHGTVRAQQVMAATDACTDRSLPWFRKRLVSVGSFVIVTEPLGEELAREVIPKARLVVDSKNIGPYIRLTPDHRLASAAGPASPPTWAAPWPR
ncbi:FAD-dependent oxidoreductase [Streptomyces botrytidirepellens]|uniref:FAD-dependent oxidoreductase n=1 Tax=Streptomyces botrytidirepellens TaxID=2486417 RepID=UPI00319D91FB